MSAVRPAASPLVPEPAEIVEKRSFGPDLHAYRMRLLDPSARPRFDFLPGQFNMVYAPGVGEVAISISSDPEEEDLEHTIRIVGRTTRVIERLGPGDVLGLRGPYGNGWPLLEARYKDVLVATGGLGCAPVSGAIDYMFRRRASYGHLTILHGVRKPADLVHRERFDAWRREPDTTVLLTADQPDRAWRARTGVVTELFEEVNLDVSRTVVLMCGPEVMMHYAIRILRARGVPDDRIHVSLERNMQCAVGWCGHCQLGTEFVCKDGPIFPVARLGRLFEVQGL
ncbi:MAG TPA: FAD/NAD(P)-binding protein [Myxococcota bacterium]|nr:FAD/NAD(P)-binding protein [Myxococcota bacterium]